MGTRDRSRRQFRRKLRADSGFGIIELVVAVGVMFTAILTMLHVVMTGFSDIGFAKQRQAANGLANQLMEEARGIAYEQITRGLATDSLGSDPASIFPCGGVWRYKSCTPATEATAPVGELIVHGARGDPAVPANQVAPLHPSRVNDTAIESTTLDRAVYVTRATNPADAYRLIVSVTWDHPMRSGPQPRVETQTLIFSPEGCRSTVTHPFAAPCQPFLYGIADAGGGIISVTGTASSTPLPAASITTPSARADIQDEQVARALGSSVASKLAIGEQTAGGLVATTAADTDGATAVPGAYEAESLSPETTTLAPSNGYSLSYTGGTGDAPTAEAAAAASATDVCPAAPAPPAAETDARPCGRGRITQNGALSLLFNLDGDLPALGSAVLGSILPASGPVAGFADRDPDVSPAAPGRTSVAVQRALGTTAIAGLPSGVTQPSNWEGYLVRLTGYSDSATAVAGTGSSPPAWNVSPGARIRYWSGSGYEEIPVPTTAATVPIGAVIAPGEGIELTITGTLSAGGATTEQSFEGASTTTRTVGKSSIAPPLTGTLHYVVTSGGATTVIPDEGGDPVVRSDCGAATSCLADLDIVVNLGTLLASTTYQAAPSA